MTKNKTIATNLDVPDFVGNIETATRREDAEVLLQFFDRVTGMKPAMWGDSIVGYGSYHYKYESGREGDYFLTGFSPRKSAMTIYVMPGFKQYTRQLELLGSHKHTVSCLYVTRLQRIDMSVLEEIIVDSVRRMKKMYHWREDPFTSS